MTAEEIHDYLASPESPGLWFFAYQVAQDASDLAGILLYDLRHRIARQKKKNIRDGRQWTYDAIRVFVETHRHSSEPGIRKAFVALERDGLIVIEKSGKYNGKRYDKKWWYSVTAKGMKAASARLMRYHPDVAVLLDIPKAVVLEHFRYKLHHGTGHDYVTIVPKKLGVPYHPKTIQRHLNGLVDSGTLARHTDDENQYCLPEVPQALTLKTEPAPLGAVAPVVAPHAGPAPIPEFEAEHNWKHDPAPITVASSKLLPALRAGDVALLVAASGTGKTSVACFTAVQMAVAGTKVLYLSIEEPIRDIIARMQASECGVGYSALHRGDAAAIAQASAALTKPSSRLRTLSNNLRTIDLRDQEPQTHILLDAIECERQKGFSPDVVIIDQLDWIAVPHELLDAHEDDRDGDARDGDDADDACDVSMRMPVAAAALIRECLGGLGLVTWVIHQVAGACEWDFTSQHIDGGEEVAEYFDCAIGIGRAANDSQELRMFSMIGAPFEQILDADFAHMRFLPKN